MISPDLHNSSPQELNFLAIKQAAREMLDRIPKETSPTIPLELRLPDNHIIYSIPCALRVQSETKHGSNGLREFRLELRLEEVKTRFSVGVVNLYISREEEQQTDVSAVSNLKSYKPSVGIGGALIQQYPPLCQSLLSHPPDALQGVESLTHSIEDLSTTASGQKGWTSYWARQLNYRQDSKDPIFWDRTYHS